MCRKVSRDHAFGLPNRKVPLQDGMHDALLLSGVELE